MYLPTTCDNRFKLDDDDDGGGHGFTVTKVTYITVVSFAVTFIRSFFRKQHLGRNHF